MKAPRGAGSGGRDALGFCAVAIVVAFAYSIGAGRGYNLDASYTVANFVATPSLLDSLERQIVYNNHVFFSFADHLVYSVTGSKREEVLRALPIVAGAAAVALIALHAARRWGWLAGAGAAAVTAFNPLMIEYGREVRGYAFLVLGAIGSTVLFVRLRESGDPGRGLVPGYVLVLAAGIATHLYAAAVMVVHAAMIGIDRRALRAWAPRWTAAFMLGLAAMVGVLPEMLEADRGRVFRSDFPVEVARELLGGTKLTAILMLPLVVGGALALRAESWFRRAALAVAALVGLIWLAAPQDLYPRFFIWLVPALGWLAAAAIRRWPPLAAFALAVLVVEVLRLGPDLDRSDLANREAGRIAEQVQAAGGRVCSLSIFDPVEPYSDAVMLISQVPETRRCDVLLQVFTGPLTEADALPTELYRQFPYQRALPAKHPGLVLSDRPLACWEPVASSGAACPPRGP